MDHGLELIIGILEILEIEVSKIPKIMEILEIEVCNTPRILEIRGIGFLLFPMIQEMQAVGGRLPLLWCAALFLFWTHVEQTRGTGIHVWFPVCFKLDRILSWNLCLEVTQFYLYLT